MSLSPHTAPALSDDDEAPVWKFSHQGRVTAAAVKPP